MFSSFLGRMNRTRKGYVILPGSNRKFRELFDKYEKAKGWNHAIIAEILGIAQKTVGRRLNAFTPINYSFVLLTAAIFDLDEEKGNAYFAAAGYTLTNYNVRDTTLVWKILKMHGQPIEEKNKVLEKYGYKPIKCLDE